MILKSTDDQIKKVESIKIFDDMLYMFRNIEYEGHDGEVEENISYKQIIYGIKKYINGLKIYFKGDELLFDVNDISDLLDLAFLAIIISQIEDDGDMGGIYSII